MIINHRVAVDDLADIPEHLFISMGDYNIFVSVRIESTTPFGGEDRGILFVRGDSNEGGDQMDPQGMNLARRVPVHGVDGGDDDTWEGNRSGQSNTWNSYEIRDKRRRVQGSRREALSFGEGSSRMGEMAGSGEALIARRFQSDLCTENFTDPHRASGASVDGLVQENELSPVTCLGYRTKPSFSLFSKEGEELCLSRKAISGLSVNDSLVNPTTEIRTSNPVALQFGSTVEGASRLEQGHVVVPPHAEFQIWNRLRSPL